MRTIYLDTKDPFILGKTGESNRTTLRVKVEQWYQEYPDGHGVILFMRPNKVVYPLETNLIEHDGEHYLEAIVTDNETKLAGFTVVTAQWYDGETLAHGLVFSGKVLTSAGNGPIDGVKETTPTWVSTLIAELATINETAATVQEAYEKMSDAVSRIDEALTTAEETVAQAQDAAETAQTAKTNAATSAAAAAVSATQAMSTTPEGYNAMVASLARVFDPATAYSAGEYVNYNSTIYRFTVDHAAGEWIGTDAVAVKMADDLGDLKSAFDAEDDLVNELHGLVNYDYDLSYNHPPIETASGGQLGMKRDRTTVVLNTLVPTSGRIWAKLNGDVMRNTGASQTANWEGIELKARHEYKFKLKYVSGVSTLDGAFRLPAVAVYVEGKAGSIGTYEQNDTEYIRYFTAEEGKRYALGMNPDKGVTYQNAKFRITLEDLTAQEEKEPETELPEAYTGLNRFGNGGWARTGAVVSTAASARILSSGEYIEDGIAYAKITDENYVIAVHAWDDSGTWQGFLTGPATLTTDSSAKIYWTDKIDFNALREAYPAYHFRIVVYNRLTAEGTNTNITPEEAVHISFYGEVPEIKAYYAEEMEKTLDTVREAITEPALVFPMMTDIHFMSGLHPFTTFNTGADNVKYFAEHLPIDFMLNLGDNTDGNTTPAETMRRSKHMLDRFAEIGAPYYMAIGNHDTNYYQSAVKLTGTETFMAYLSNTRGVVFDDSEYNLSFYKDFEELGVRLLVLDLNYLAQYTSAATLAAWVSGTALNTSKTILLCTHLSMYKYQNWANQGIGNSAGIVSALESFVNGGGTVVQLCGHAHADYYFNAPWLYVVSSCQKLEQADVTGENYQSITGEIGDIVSPARALGTVTEDLWTACVLKPKSQELDMIRFGAGVDRRFHYGKLNAASAGTLTTVLTGAAWTTSDATVATVSDGTVTAVGSGMCQITATDTDGNFETWTVVN